MRTLAIALLAAALTPAPARAPGHACPTKPFQSSPSSQERRSGVDPVLRRLAAAHPQLVTSALVELNGAPPAVPGVAFGRPLGRIATARGPAAALAALGDRLPRVEAARRCRPLGDVAGASTIAFRGSTIGETDSYSFAGVAGQTVRILVLTEDALDPLLTVTDAAPVSDDNSGPGDGCRLDVTWASTGAKTIDVAPVPATAGAYLLIITADSPLAPGDLTGGDIGADTPHVAGTRARETRAAESVDGVGVLVGLVDTGIDHTHADFLRADGTSRIAGIWDQTLTAQAGESVPSAGYGVHYKADDIATPGAVRSQDTDGHGTHVASIAAGDNAVFTGAAPGASLLMVKFNGTTTGAVDGLAFILDEAERLEFDAVVVNASLGTHDGPHDGTSLLDRAVDAAVARGRHIVVAAGNESDPTGGIVHASATVAGSVTWTFVPTVAATLSPHVLDLWAQGADEYTVTADDGSNTLTTASGQTGTFGPSATAVTITIENRVDSPSNGATHIRIEILSPFPVVPWSITLARTTSGGTGLVDGYVGSATGTWNLADITLNADGSIPGIVAEPGTAAGAITVGAYRGKFGWDTASTTTVQADGTGAGVAGDLALFSARGPTRDGRTKPDLAAPGAYLAGARSANSAPAAGDIDADGVHVYKQGTSMAAPQVAGIVALVLQKNRLLTNDEMKALLAASALVDGEVTVGPAWGAGKVNALASVAGVFTQVDIRADGGTCANAATGPGSGAALCFAAALAAFALRRIR